MTMARQLFTPQQLEVRRPVWDTLGDLYLDTDTCPDLPRMARVLAESGLNEAELNTIYHLAGWGRCHWSRASPLPRPEADPGRRMTAEQAVDWADPVVQDEYLRLHRQDQWRTSTGSLVALALLTLIGVFQLVWGGTAGVGCLPPWHCWG